MPKLARDVENAIKEIMEKPELNKSSDVALYGTAETIPDKKFMETFLHLHTESYLEVQKN